MHYDELENARADQIKINELVSFAFNVNSSKTLSFLSIKWSVKQIVRGE